MLSPDITDFIMNDDPYDVQIHHEILSSQTNSPSNDKMGDQLDELFFTNFLDPNELDDLEDTTGASCMTKEFDYHHDNKTDLKPYETSLEKCCEDSVTSRSSDSSVSAVSALTDHEGHHHYPKKQKM